MLKIALNKAISAPPVSFATSTPPRMVVDLVDTTNATGLTRKQLDLGSMRSVDIVQSGGRTRLVLNLSRTMSYNTQIKGRQLIVLLASEVSVANGADKAALIAAEKNAIVDVDFRAGVEGAGRIIIDLARAPLTVDVRQQGQAIAVDFLKTSLPDAWRRRLEVKDFSTPVQTITTSA